MHSQRTSANISPMDASEIEKMFEVAPYALSLLRWPSGEIVYTNAEWCRRFGFSKQEVYGKTPRAVGIYQSIEERDRIHAIIQRDGAARGFETTVGTKSGEPRLFTCNIDVIELGGKTFILSALEDITERRRTEFELKRSQESLVFALESARMGTWEIDLQNNFVHCSPGMLALWGIDAETFSGDRNCLQSKVHPEDRETMKAAITDAINSRGIYEAEYRIVPLPGEERWVISRGRCTYAPGTDKPNRFSGVVCEITEERRARATAENAVKARDNMISVSAHELLTPISGTKLLVQTLKKKLEKGEDLSREALIKIASQTDHGLNRLSKLVNDMLDMSRINLGKFTVKRERVDLSALVSATVERSLPMIESAECSAQIFVEPGIEAWVDPGRIEQVISNLISNSCRYASGKPIEIRLERAGDAARLSVTDEGVGIDQKDHARIFERFERATTLDEKAGLGLGLFLVKQILDAHSGEVRVESRLGKGAKFTVELPLQEESHAKEI